MLYRMNRNWRKNKLEKSLNTKCAFEENMHVSTFILSMIHIRFFLNYVVSNNDCKSFLQKPLNQSRKACSNLVSD